MGAMLFHRGPRPGLRRPGLLILVVLVIAIAPPQSVFAELRTIVRDMMENLGSVDQIGEGIALGDYDQVQKAARDLKDRAQKMKKGDLIALGLDPRQVPKLDAYLRAQRAAAEQILKAAKRENSREAFRGLQQLLQTSCLPCHADFREGENLRNPATLFMTTFLNAWQDMNRGLAIDDLSLVNRGSQEIATMSRVLAWDQVIEATFALDDPEERRDFRKILRQVASSAAEITLAANQEDKLTIIRAVGEMWNDGCILCHERFRDGE